MELARPISTNTLLAEGDSDSPMHIPPIFEISTNTLLAEGDIGVLQAHISSWEFQPTPSSRRVTTTRVTSKKTTTISTNTLLAEGDAPGRPNTWGTLSISTNTLLAEGDAKT